jgi:dihydroxyacid dehydratase/phosphogluconate dehydratase
VKNANVIRPVENPHSAKGGLAILFGNLAPEGSVIKTAGVSSAMRKFLKARKMRRQEFLQVKFKPAMLSSSAMKGLAADPVCRKCSHLLQPLWEWD